MDKRKCDDTCPYDSTQPLQRCDFTSATSEKCPTDVCPPFMKQTNGKVLGNTYEEGHKRRLQCNHGYLPLDPNNVTSQCQNGRWTNFTTCVQMCPPFENKSNGKVVGDSFIEGATRNLTCNKNYSPRNGTNVESRCSNGKWSKITECVKVCPPFGEIKNGTVFGDSVFEGANRTLNCNQNYSPRNTTNVVSRCENGQWSIITECVQVCPPFGEIKNGTVFGDSVFEGANRTLNCNQNYSPRNNTNVVSRCENGQWSTITECVQVCHPFGEIKNGTVFGDSVFEGANRTLNCNQNYSPRNNTNVALNESKLTSVCDNGIWSSITRCVPDKWVYRAFEFNQSIYVFTNQSDTFAEAVAFCEKGDGHVITLDDETEQQWVKQTAPIENALWEFWLGITETNVTGKCTRMHDKANVSYNNWASGQPNNANGDQECVIANRKYQWAWDDRLCTDIYFIVCELSN
ncbi:hypothetical protein DPMN_061081 [Dreissena polymorpha]|uniref:Uncharacterized protein n=1 Tax=Dreissena polymorpha TaxID=45954 RepID=A0A9D4HI28_DREPO|nr:hypothetical protein DPMN_061081 [Dreissena polymorpha]